MGQPRATMTSKGQFTMPKALRDELNLKAGDSIEFVREGSRYFVRPRTGRLVDLAGILGNPLGRPVSIEEMDEGIADALGEDDERIRREWHEWREGRGDRE